MNWWHLARTPDGVYALQLDPIAVQAEADKRCAEDLELEPDHAISEVLGEMAATHRAELGFPPNGRWVHRDEWDSQLSQGEPHPNLLATATVSRA